MYIHGQQDREESEMEYANSARELKKNLSRMTTKELEDYELFTRPMGLEGDASFLSDPGYIACRFLVIAELFGRPDSSFYKGRLM